MTKVVQTAPDVSEARSPEKPQPSAAHGLNIENIKRVRDHIAALPAERFSMTHVRRASKCGTVCCIAGWTTELLGEGLAFETLGITGEQAMALFMPTGWWDDRYTIPQAVAVLDHLMATGEVNWSAALDDGEATGPSSALEGAVGTQGEPA